jgi:hypothetical protein
MSRALSDWIDSYMEYTEHTEPPSTYRRWVAISAVAASLQRRNRLELGSLLFFPNMYIVLIGPPGTRKGTAMGPVISILREVGIDMGADSSTREALIRRLRVSTDTGVDGAHASMNIISTEFTTFLGFSNKELISMLCKWYDCEDKFEYDTKTPELKDYVHNVWVNMLGATTPTQLRQALNVETFGTGLTSRIIFVHAKRKNLKVFPYLIKELKAPLKEDLQRINMISGLFRPDEEFLSKYKEWREEAEENPPFSSVYLDFYNDRRPTHLLKLSMLLSASRSDERIIERRDLDRAIELLEEVERPMSEVFEGIGKAPHADLIPGIVSVIKEEGRVRGPDLFAKFSADITRKEFAEIIAGLQYRGVIKYVDEGETRYCEYIGFEN